MKKIIIGTNLNQNLEHLYHDILKLIYIDNLNLKKLVYIYIINYSQLM